MFHLRNNGRKKVNIIMILDSKIEGVACFSNKSVHSSAQEKCYSKVNIVLIIAEETAACNVSFHFDLTTDDYDFGTNET